MKRRLGRWKGALLVLASSAGCEDAVPVEGGGDPAFRGVHADTLRLGEGMNPEAVITLGDEPRVLVVSSKSRDLTLLEVADGRLAVVREATLFTADASDSELTHLAIHPRLEWAILTRTVVERDAGDAVVDCRGTVVFVDVRDGPSFGAVRAELEIGPMPDAVAISPDGRHAAVANERDVVWGKCEGVEGLAPPSVSLLDLGDRPEEAREVARIVMEGDPKREPEQLAFSASGDLIAVTLQDSHELLLVPVDAATSLHDPSDASGAFTIVALPPNELGQAPWPDGVARLHGTGGEDVFAVAGEANDALLLVSRAGEVVSSLPITPSDVPAAFPRDGSWGPLFEPDSLTAFVWKTRPHLALTLKASGAVAIFDVAAPAAPRLTSVVKIGDSDELGREGRSSVESEGVASSDVHAFIVVANEAEGSVSLVLPEP